MTLLQSPRQFQNTVSENVLEEQLPDKPITSIKDIQYVYGMLFILSTVGENKHGKYLTPTQSTDLFGEENSLIEVYVDLSGDTAQIDPDQPVRITEYNEHLVSKVAHSYYANKGSGVDHSLTHRSGSDKPPEKLASYALDRITRWPNEDAVKDLEDTHKDGWIIKQLNQLGRELSNIEEGQTTIEQTITNQLEEDTTSLLTLRLKLEEGGEYLYPGEIEVLNEGTKAQKLDKLISKGGAKNSKGESTSYVKGEDTTTVGTATDPLNYYLGKQLEKFPNFDIDSAWTSLSLSEDEAVTISQSTTFLEACSFTNYQMNVYSLPYLTGKLTSGDAYLLYTLLYRAYQNDSLSPIESAYKELDEVNEEIANRLRFHTILLEKEQASLFNVFGETTAGTVLYPSEISQAHQSILNSWMYDASGEHESRISAPFGSYSNNNLLAGDPIFNEVANGDYVYQTCARGGDDPASDDDRISIYTAMLAGEPISERKLISNYIKFLMDRENKHESKYTDSIAEAGPTTFPTYKIGQQYAQHEALQQVGLLEQIDTDRQKMTTYPITEFNTMTNDTTDDEEDVSKAELREQKLNRFLEESAVLQDTPSRGCFLVGVLVGEVSNYQYRYEELSTTLIDQYSVANVSKNKIKRLIQDALNKNFIYSSRNNLSSGMYAEVTDRIAETFAQTDPDEWELSRDEIRYYYSIGVAYGLNNWVEQPEESTEEAEATA